MDRICYVKLTGTKNNAIYVNIDKICVIEDFSNMAKDYKAVVKVEGFNGSFLVKETPEEIGDQIIETLKT